MSVPLPVSKVVAAVAGVPFIAKLPTVSSKMPIRNSVPLASVTVAVSAKRLLAPRRTLPASMFTAEAATVPFSCSSPLPFCRSAPVPEIVPMAMLSLRLKASVAPGFTVIVPAPSRAPLVLPSPTVSSPVLTVLLVFTVSVARIDEVPALVSVLAVRGALMLLLLSAMLPTIRLPVPLTSGLPVTVSTVSLPTKLS